VPRHIAMPLPCRLLAYADVIATYDMLLSLFRHYY